MHIIPFSVAIVGPVASQSCIIVVKDNTTVVQRHTVDKFLCKSKRKLKLN
jgi:hypothetical protein